MTVISGYAATFDRADSQADLIRPGAFRDTLARRGARVPLLWQHQISEPIGRLIDLHEDARGLWFTAELSPSRRATDADALIRTGALRECSIGFLPRRVRFQRRGAQTVRLIHELDLIEISLVTLAANPAARIVTISGVPLGPRTAAAGHAARAANGLPRDTGPPLSSDHLQRRLAVAVPIPL